MSACVISKVCSLLFCSVLGRYMGHGSKIEESWFLECSSQSFSLTTVKTDNEKGLHDWKASTGNTEMSENVNPSKRSCENWLWSDRNYTYQKKVNCSQRGNVAGEMERQDPIDVKDNLCITAKPMDTNRCSNDKKLTCLKTLNYITMYPYSQGNYQSPNV